MTMRYRAGDVLFREGDPGDFTARILDGRVIVVKELDGESIRLGELIVNGQYLGGIFTKDKLALQFGDNLVVAGGVTSPFLFRIEVTG